MNAQTFEQALAATGIPSPRGITRTLHLIGLAAEIVDDYTRRHPTLQVRLRSLYSPMFSSPTIIDELFRSHAAELCERALTGGDLIDPTDAELSIALSSMSLKAPLQRDYGALYEHCMRRVMPDKMDEMLGAADLRPSHMGGVAVVRATVCRALRREPGWRT
jgi:hypothetical protein